MDEKTDYLVRYVLAEVCLKREYLQWEVLL